MDPAVVKPTVIELMDPLTGIRSELKFEEVVCFCSFEPGYMSVGDEEVSGIVLKPSASRIGTVHNLTMKNKEGVVMPGHLPNINDMYKRVDLVDIRRRLEGILEDAPGVPLCTTNFFALIVDPPPVLDLSREIFPLMNAEVTLKLGSHTDGLQVFAVNALLTSIRVTATWHFNEKGSSLHVNQVNFLPWVNSGADPIPFGERIVVWNFRGVMRPSLDYNLKLLFDTYKPVEIILTKTRVGGLNFDRVVERLNLTKKHSRWEVDEADSLEGGFVVYWVKMKVHVDVLKIARDYVRELRFPGDIEAPLD